MVKQNGKIEELDDNFFAAPHQAYRRWSERANVHRVRFADGRSGWVAAAPEGTPRMSLAAEAESLEWHEGFRVRGLVGLPLRLS